jgi:hypothetical protein
MLISPITGNRDLDSFLYDISISGVEGGGGGGGITPNASTGAISDSSGNVISYLNQYIHIKYADNGSGGGMSNSPTGKTHYGVSSSKVTTESTNTAAYDWYQVDGPGFGTTRNLYYQVRGGRQIGFVVDTSPPNYTWLLDSGAAIDLDSIVPAQTITSAELLNGAVTELKIAAAAVSASKLNVAAIDSSSGDLAVNSVTAVNIEAGAVVADKIAANSVTSDKITANAVTAVKLAAGAVTAEKIDVINLSAISANMGSITAGSISINDKFIVDPNGTTTIRSGTTGARLEIFNNVIKVFDEAGVLRVKIGDLS